MSCLEQGGSRIKGAGRRLRSGPVRAKAQSATEVCSVCKLESHDTASLLGLNFCVHVILLPQLPES